MRINSTSNQTNPSLTAHLHPRLGPLLYPSLDSLLHPSLAPHHHLSQAPQRTWEASLTQDKYCSIRPQGGGGTEVLRTRQAKAADIHASHTAILHGVPSLAPEAAIAQTICQVAIIPQTFGMI
ncbi:hypothetical protein E2C01_035637 [Portunus trituberculatus]|uniref:Uncharacterized protein n=1 Tax=Portunus trituberculatus TaxID=210409 RepID=A0A5B7F8W7_PORTR|nr:hypothetical protein [Portunus trituberculatus]